MHRGRLIVQKYLKGLLQDRDRGRLLDDDDVVNEADSEPFLNTGVTIVDFQIVGNVDNSYDVLNISDRGIASEPATFFKTLQIARPDLQMFLA